MTQQGADHTDAGPGEVGDRRQCLAALLYPCNRRQSFGKTGGRVHRQHILDLRAERLPGVVIVFGREACSLGMTKSAALDYAKRGIRVNAVGPGPVEAPLLASGTGGDPHSYASIVPMGRIGQPEDIANPVAWLLSDEAQYVTGQPTHRQTVPAPSDLRTDRRRLCLRSWVVMLRCTAKVLALLGVSEPAIGQANQQDWYAHLVWIDRRKCLLVTSPHAPRDLAGPCSPATSFGAFCT